MIFSVCKYQKSKKKLISVATNKFHLKNIKITNGVKNIIAPLINRQILLVFLYAISKRITVPKSTKKLPKKPISTKYIINPFMCIFGILSQYYKQR